MGFLQACVEAGTDYLDITGEPEFIETMQLKYHQQAKEKVPARKRLIIFIPTSMQSVLIVSACGFDSIPNDMGVLFTLQSYPADATPASVDSYFSVKSGLLLDTAVAPSDGRWQATTGSRATTRRTSARCTALAARRACPRSAKRATPCRSPWSAPAPRSTTAYHCDCTDGLMLAGTRARSSPRRWASTRCRFRAPMPALSSAHRSTLLAPV